MKKSICISLVVLIILMSVSYADIIVPFEQEKINQTSILDSNVSAWAKEEVESANKNALIPSSLNDQNLKNNITREEFAAIAVCFYEKLTGNKAEVVDNPFEDTTNDYVLKAYGLGITTGMSESIFAPNKLVTREQLATMMYRALSKAGIDTKLKEDNSNKFSDDDSMHSWSRDAIYFMSNVEIIKGIGNNTFGVSGNATREQAILISYRSFEKFNKSQNNVVETKIEESKNAETKVEETNNTETKIEESKAENTIKPDPNVQNDPTYPTIYVDVNVVEYSGTGKKVITGVNLANIPYYCEYTHNGDRNFIVHLYYGDDNSKTLYLVNEVKQVSGQVFLDVRENNVNDGYLEVSADGDWNIKFIPVHGTTTTSIKGSGKVVSGLFKASQKNNIVKYNYTGERNFIVHIFEYGNGMKPTKTVFLANEVGSCDGETVVVLNQGKWYFFEVSSSEVGNWKITFDQGDQETTLKPPAVPQAKPKETVSSSSSSTRSSSRTSSSSSSSSTSSSSKSSSKKYSYSDASQLYEDAEDMYNLINKASSYADKAVKTSGAEKTIYIKQAISNAKNAKVLASSIKKLVNSKDDLDLSDGTSWQDYIQDAYDLIDEITDMDESDDALDVQKKCYKAQVQCLGVYKLASKLIKEFN